MLKPVSDHPGWFITMCVQKTDAQSVRLRVSPGHYDQKQEWRTWLNDGHDPVEFDLPYNLLYVHDVWVQVLTNPSGNTSEPA